MEIKKVIMKITTKLIKFFSRSSIKNVDFWRYIYNITLQELGIGSGGNISSSVENNFLQIIKKSNLENKKLTIFDVGTNKGQYTSHLLSVFPDASIHTFEPSPETFAELCKNITSENVKLNNFGISDSKCNMELYFDEHCSGLASVYKRQLDSFDIDFSKHETCSFDTLDNYCAVNNIDNIDLLKLDIEGNELKALFGGKGLLDKGAIKYIQLEFGGCNIDSRTFFRDFWNLLHNDYYVYRIMRDGLWEVKKYYETLEIFHCTNFAFIKK